MSLENVIAVARRELGNTELPAGSNRTKYGAAYGMDGQPWCVIFLWWCFHMAGEGDAFYGGGKTASCGELLRWARGGGLTVPANEVQPGDIVILDFSGTGDTQHCGIVVGALSDPGTRDNALIYIYTIEGNTTPGAEGSQDNGGSVASKVRYPRQIVGVIRPQYKEEAMPEVKDYKGHWAEDALDWAYDKGFINGYEDGTTRPDAACTRAELVTILRRYDDYRFGGTEK